MITIPVAELKAFFSRAKHIKENNLLPIYSYIKLVCKGKNAVLYKFNGNSFIVYPISAEFKKDITVLLNTQIMQSYVSFTTANEISITVEDLLIKFTDGKTPGQFQTAEVAHFPVIQEKEKDSEEFELTQEMLESLFIAKSHTLQQRMPENWLTYIHVKSFGKKNYIFASTGAICYSKQFKEKMPDLIIEPEIAEAIGEFTSIKYYQAGNYNMFDTGIFTYGFIQPHLKTPDFTTVLNKLDKEKNFVVNRKEMIAFCEMAVAMDRSSVPTEISIEDAPKKKIRLRLKSLQDDLKLEPEIEAIKTGKVETALFLAKQLLICLKNLSCEKIQFNGLIQGNYFLTTEEDKNYIGTILQVVYTTEPKTQTE